MLGVRSVGAVTVVGFGVGSGCVGYSLVAVVHGSAWGGVSKVMGKGVAASVALGMGMDPESGASVNVGALTGGAEVAATGSSCGVGPASFGGLSGSSTVSIVCCPVASLSASFAWSWWVISNLAAQYSSRICATFSECRSARG